MYKTTVFWILILLCLSNVSIGQDHSIALKAGYYKFNAISEDDASISANFLTVGYTGFISFWGNASTLSFGIVNADITQFRSTSSESGLMFEFSNRAYLQDEITGLHIGYGIDVQLLDTRNVYRATLDLGYTFNFTSEPFIGVTPGISGHYGLAQNKNDGFDSFFGFSYAPTLSFSIAFY